MASGRVRGGQKARRFIGNAKAAKGLSSVEVGFFSSARYPDGTPVTNVAAWNEFGTENADGEQLIPERPFFRNALNNAEPELTALLRDHVDPKTMVVDARTGGLLGAAMQARIQKSIRNLKTPANAESTKKSKGSSNPLIDLGFMVRSVTWKTT